MTNLASTIVEGFSTAGSGDAASWHDLRFKCHPLRRWHLYKDVRHWGCSVYFYFPFFSSNFRSLYRTSRLLSSTFFVNDKEQFPTFSMFVFNYGKIWYFYKSTNVSM